MSDAIACLHDLSQFRFQRLRNTTRPPSKGPDRSADPFQPSSQRLFRSRGRHQQLRNAHQSKSRHGPVVIVTTQSRNDKQTTGLAGNISWALTSLARARRCTMSGANIVPTQLQTTKITKKPAPAIEPTRAALERQLPNCMRRFGSIEAV